jgi:hypothetical protein
MKHKLYKRCIFALALLLATSAIADAQISISKFEEDPSDTEGRISYRREKPQSGGELYALIKITTMLDCNGFYVPDFGPGAGMGEFDCSGGRVWMYAPAGATKISIRHNVAGSLESYPLPAPLKAGAVYLLELKSGTQRTYTEEQLGIGYLVVTGYVEGATIKIGDREEFMTGKRWTTSLPTGTYDYEISASGYETCRGKVLIKDEQMIEITVQMISSMGEISIHSADNGKIVIDNNLVATGNYQGRIATGLHSLIVEKDGHRPYRKSITVVAGKDQTIEVPVLKPIE